jgi:hypothetical protein
MPGPLSAAGPIAGTPNVGAKATHRLIFRIRMLYPANVQQVEVLPVRSNCGTIGRCALPVGNLFKVTGPSFFK